MPFSNDLLVNEREYVAQATQDYQAGAFYGRRDLSTLSRMATLTRRYAEQMADEIEALHCGQPDKQPTYSLSAIIAEAVDDFMSPQAWRVFASALDSELAVSKSMEPA